MKQGPHSLANLVYSEGNRLSLAPVKYSIASFRCTTYPFSDRVLKEQYPPALSWQMPHELDFLLRGQRTFTRARRVLYRKQPKFAKRLYSSV